MCLEETAGLIEMAFAMWGAVGPRNHVLDRGLDLSWQGAVLGDFLPIEKHWDCVLPSVQRATHDTCRPLAKNTEAIRRVGLACFGLLVETDMKVVIDHFQKTLKSRL